MDTVERTILKQPEAAGPDFSAIKQKQQVTWSSGDYGVIGVTLQIVGETLAEAVDIRAGERVIDIAAGNGNMTLAAARRYANVVSTDYVPELLDKGRVRALAEGLPVNFRAADAEALPFEGGSFDVAVSTFGAMFTPDHTKPALEMLRVVRKGGRIGLANWTPESFIGQLFKVIGKFITPPAGVRSPLEWGSVDRLGELFAGHIVEANVRQFVFRYRSANEWLDTFRTYYGPTHKAFGAVDDADRDVFERELLDLAHAHNTATDGTWRVPSDYLEVVVTVS